MGPKSGRQIPEKSLGQRVWDFLNHDPSEDWEFTQKLSFGNAWFSHFKSEFAKQTKGWKKQADKIDLVFRGTPGVGRELVTSWMPVAARMSMACAIVEQSVEFCNRVRLEELGYNDSVTLEAFGRSFPKVSPLVKQIVQDLRPLESSLGPSAVLATLASHKLLHPSLGERIATLVQLGDLTVVLLWRARHLMTDSPLSLKDIAGSKQRIDAIQEEVQAALLAADNRITPLQPRSSAADQGIEMSPSASSTPTRILHLSDLHIEPGSDPHSLAQPLIQDLEDGNEGLGIRSIDYLVVSGDITNNAAKEEFDAAAAFLKLVVAKFNIAEDRILIVPGNHDQSWDVDAYAWKRGEPAKSPSGSFVQKEGGYLKRDDEAYPRRFTAFALFHRGLVGAEYPLAGADQGVVRSFDRLQFILLNSAWQIDEHFPERSSINDTALSKALSSLGTNDSKSLRVAVWHHPITGNEKIVDDAFIGRLKKADVKLCLHGHVHEIRADLVGYQDSRSLHVVGAGSFGAPSNHRPEATPCLYNLLEVSEDLTTVTVHTRKRDRRGGAFEGHAVWETGVPSQKQSFYEITLNPH